jgi:hypothetical protein
MYLFTICLTKISVVLQRRTQDDYYTQRLSVSFRSVEPFDFAISLKSHYSCATQYKRSVNFIPVLDAMEKILVNPGRPVPSLLTISTELSRILYKNVLKVLFLENVPKFYVFIYDLFNDNIGSATASNTGRLLNATFISFIQMRRAIRFCHFSKKPLFLCHSV